MRTVNVDPTAYRKSPVSTITNSTKKTAKESAEVKTKKETKTERVTLLFRPSVWENFITLANLMDRSPNDLLNDYCERMTETNKELIEQHKAMTEANRKKVKEVL